MKKLNMIAAMGYTGYGVASFNILKGLVERGWDVCLIPKGPIDQRLEEDNRLVANCVHKNFHYDADCFTIWHQFDLMNKVGRGRHIVYPFFELNKFNDKEKHHLGYADDIVVSSDWARVIIDNNDITCPTHVVPLGVNTNVFKPPQKPREEGSPVKFLNVGKWEIRKGHDFIIDIFHKAFDVKDNVELWMMPHNPFLSKHDQANWEKMYWDTPMGRAGKVKIIPWQQDHYGVAEVMKDADCGFFPSRAEGWNLELLEMMAMGKPVIATYYSAHTEFCNPGNCHLIKVNDLTPAFDGMWFHEQGDWALLEDEHFDAMVEDLKYIEEAYHMPGVYINDGGIQTAKKFTWENTVDCLEKVLDKS